MSVTLPKPGPESSTAPLLDLFVAGIPRPGGSKTAQAIYDRNGEPVVKNGRVITTTREAGKYTPAWRADVKDAAARAWGNRALLDEPLYLVLTFIMPRPKGHYGSGKNAGVLKANAPNFHATAPDTTKLIRAVEDSLTKVVIFDDSRIVRQHAWKIYGDKPGVRIELLAAEVSTPVDAPLFAGGVS